MDGEMMSPSRLHVSCSCVHLCVYFVCVFSFHRTPLHCAASCNSVHLCKLLVESGAAIFASTISDVETAADKCEEMEEGYIQCSQFLYGKTQPTSQTTVQIVILVHSVQSCLIFRQVRSKSASVL